MRNYFLPLALLQPLSVWKRNYTEWIAFPFIALCFPLIEPIILLLFFGYGITGYYNIPNKHEYLQYLGAGFIAAWSMNTTVFEFTYMVYTRMVEKRIYEQMLLSPLSIKSIIFGEILWGVSRAIVVSIGLLIILYTLGIFRSYTYIPACILACILSSTSIAGVTLIVTSYARNYQYFSYYFTLVILPMMLTSGIYFPISYFPQSVQIVVQLLPLYHAVEIIRSVVFDLPLDNLVVHFSVLIFYSLMPIYIAIPLMKKRLIT